MGIGAVIEEHWAKASALVGVVFQALLAFQTNLANISLLARFLVGGLAGVCSAVSIAHIFSLKRPEQSVGFGQRVDSPSKTPWWYIGRVFMIIVVCALSIVLLRQIATFHSVQVLERHSPNDPLVGTVEIQPAHRPATLTLTLSTNQGQRVEIAYIAPSSWNDRDPVSWGVQNQNEYGMTLELKNFKSPQVFGVWYRLSATNGRLGIDANSDPPEVQIIRAQEIAEYRKNIWIFGGVLCLGTLLYWAYLSSWFRLAS